MLKISLLLIFSFSLIIATYSECIDVVKREEWTTAPPKKVQQQPKPIMYAIIAHTGTPECLSSSDCRRRVDNIRAYHMNQLAWDDIGYNFVIGGDGNIYEGRGWHVLGAHTKNWNNNSIGIAFIGTFNNKSPNDAQLKVAKNLLSCGVEEDELDINYKLIGQRQVRNTDSPGLKLYWEIQKWPHWTENP